MRIPVLVLALTISACGANENGASSSGGNEPASCRPAGLETTPAIAQLQLPPGCQLSPMGTASAPHAIGSREDLEQVLRCQSGVPSTIDLDENDLLVVAFSMSPAYGGTEVLDDGTTVTLLTQQRSPCPDDPRPMPTPSVLAFSLPKGAARTFEQAVCNLPADCPN